jgi:hypothetical protein
MEWVGDHVRLSEYFPQCEYIERFARPTGLISRLNASEARLLALACRLISCMTSTRLEETSELIGYAVGIEYPSIIMKDKDEVVVENISVD